MITVLIIIMIVFVSGYAFNNRHFYEKLLFDLNKVRAGYDHYRLLSSGFLHADYGHLIFNLISFHSFANSIERAYTSGHVFIIFFGSVIIGNLFALVWHRKEPNYRAVGASGGVLGIIYASLVLMKGGAVYMYFIPIPIPDKIFAVCYLAFTTVFLNRNSDNIGHAAHLGGAISGIVLGFMYRPDLIFTQYYMLLWILIPFVLMKMFDAYQKRRYY